MKVFNHIRTLLIALGAVIAFVSLSITASAQAISYHALRYGTNRTSIASGYFVNPANVTVSGNHYVVTMQIKTAKNLSSFPVAVNWVNGQKPKNVRKVKDRAGNSRYYYSFTTTNLRKRINAKLAIDVPKVYKAHHLISFKFNTANLPSLGKKTTTHVSAAVSAHPKAAAASTQSSASKRSSVTSASSHKAAVPTKKQTQKTPNKSAASKSSASDKKADHSSQKPSSQSSAAKSASSKPKQESHAVKKASNHTPWIIGGVVVVVAVAGGGSWLFFRH